MLTKQKDFQGCKLKQYEANRKIMIIDDKAVIVRGKLTLLPGSIDLFLNDIVNLFEMLTTEINQWLTLRIA